MLIYILFGGEEGLVKNVMWQGGRVSNQALQTVTYGDGEKGSKCSIFPLRTFPYPVPFHGLSFGKKINTGQEV